MRRTAANGVPYYTVPSWEASVQIVHGFFTRKGGVSPPPYDSLNLGGKGGDSREHVRRNLQRIAEALSLSAASIFCARQVHGDRILTVSGTDTSLFEGGDAAPRADGLLTAEPGVCLGVLTADCVPLLFFDPLRSAVGAVHAGWRGTVKGIAHKAVERMVRAFGSDPADLLVALGPSIGPCCYEVGEEVAEAFHAAGHGRDGPCLQGKGRGRWRLNLAGINRHQLLRAGVRPGNVTVSPLCTSCRRTLFFSARGEGEPTGRQLALIGLVPAEPAGQSPERTEGA